jgi:hypothetical protein
VVVGGLISAFGVWLKDVRDGRHAVQKWVEEEFVFGGVVRTLDGVRLMLLQREVTVVQVRHAAGFPVAEVAKLRILIDSDELSVFIQLLGKLAVRVANYQDGEEIANIVVELRSHLNQLERLLLVARLKDKGCIYSLAERKSFREIAFAIGSTRRKLEEVSRKNQTV